jgi:predicted nucleic acid-binding protein
MIDSIATQLKVNIMTAAQRGDFPGHDDCLEMLNTIEMPEWNDPVFEIVEAHLANQLMPTNPFEDELHLALASYHHCDFLVTWNCQHLANANKFGQIRRVEGYTTQSVDYEISLRSNRPSLIVGRSIRPLLL